MKDKIAIVTGGAKRLGREIVKHLVTNNWQVILHYNSSKEEAHKLQEILKPGSVFLLQKDFSKFFCEEELFRKILLLTNNHKPKLLINNASSFENDTIETLEPQSLLKQIQINCIAPILLGREFSKNNKDSSIVNILDLYAFETSKNFASHQLSKAALLKATKQMALEFGETTRVNSITPSFVMQNEKQDKEIFQSNIMSSLLKTIVEPQDICNTIDFLIKTKSITGENITLDCGRKILL